MAGDLIDRLRQRFEQRPEIVEKRMVSGRSFSVGGRMFCGVASGQLMVRLAPDELDDALAEPGVRHLQFGSRHIVGYVVVADEVIADDTVLDGWLARGLRSVPSWTKAPLPRSRRRQDV